jgi:hypothetical protein
MTTTTNGKLDGAVVDARPQHLIALDRANQIRLQQAAVKRWLGEPSDAQSSRRRAVTLINRPSEAAARMTIAALLGACRQTGPVTIRKLLRRLDIGELKLVGQLTPHQAQRLEKALTRPLTEQLEFTAP